MQVEFEKDSVHPSVLTGLLVVYESSLSAFQATSLFRMPQRSNQTTKACTDAYNPKDRPAETLWCMDSTWTAVKNVAAHIFKRRWPVITAVELRLDMYSPANLFSAQKNIEKAFDRLQLVLCPRPLKNTVATEARPAKLAFAWHAEGALRIGKALAENTKSRRKLSRGPWKEGRLLHNPSPTWMYGGYVMGYGPSDPFRHPSDRRITSAAQPTGLMDLSG
ncbi:hypothetical protein WJX77_006037 [Trebouxia sp. C0004]